jgi:hypothetical protein
MSDPVSLPAKLWAYLLERFPPGPTLLYAAALFCAPWALAGRLAGAEPASWVQAVLGSLVFFLCLLHVRLMDEHKDFDKDCEAYPERLLSRGVVTLKMLKGALVVVLAVEACFALALGLQALAVWGLLLLFTLAMLVEFGVGEWLSERLGWYLISHQAMVVIMAILGVATRVDLRTLGGEGWLQVAALSLGMICATVTFELGRKTWSPDREHRAADSYTRVWGRPRTVITTLAVAVVGLSCWAWLLPSAGASWVPGMVTGGALALLVLAELLFLKRPDRKRSKLVELSGAVYALAALIGAAVAFVLAS